MYIDRIPFFIKERLLKFKSNEKIIDLVKKKITDNDEYFADKYTLRVSYTRTPIQELFDLEELSSTKKVLMSPAQVKKKNIISSEALETLLQPAKKTMVLSTLKKPKRDDVY